MKLSELIAEEAISAGSLGPFAIADRITARLHECVRPLEWWAYCSSSGNCEATTPFGKYVCARIGLDAYAVWSPKASAPKDEHDLGVFGTRDAAKAASQSHYASQTIAGLNL